MISPAGFHFWDNRILHHYLMNETVLHVTEWDPSLVVFAYFVTPLNPTQGVSIKKLTVYYMDNGSGGNDYVYALLRRADVLTGVMDTMATITTQGLSSSPTRLSRYTTSLTNKVVDNKTYASTLTVIFPHNCSTAVEFYGAKIEW